MTKLNVVFRTDASLDIGNGHVMRCLTLAEALRESGANCQFVCREHPGNLLELIAERGFAFHALPLHEYSHSPCQEVVGEKNSHTDYASWLGADWATDVEQTLASIGKIAVDWLVVDHYAIDSRWEQQLHTACRRLMVIDDLSDRRHDCDLLLDQNLCRATSDYEDLVPKGCTVFTGPSYALLRPEFSSLRSYSLTRRAKSPLKHLLITMGGVDKTNVTGKVLESLKNCRLPSEFCITVVMGPFAPWLVQVRDQAENMPWETEVLVNVQDMAQLMCESDLAIGAAGSTSWERCCLGVPAITATLADNQSHIAKGLEDEGAARIVHLESLEADMENVFEEIYESPALLKKMSSAAAMITSGEGVSILVNYFLSRS